MEIIVARRLVYMGGHHPIGGRRSEQRVALIYLMSLDRYPFIELEAQTHLSSIPSLYLYILASVITSLLILNYLLQDQHVYRNSSSSSCSRERYYPNDDPRATG